MISFFSLVVAVLAVIVGPLVTWAVARQQIAVAARETWIREFREQVAAFLTSVAAFEDEASDVLFSTSSRNMDEKSRAEMNNVLTRCYHAIRLLIAEKDTQYAAFVQIMSDMVNAPLNTHELPLLEPGDRVQAFCAAAEGILRRERAAIVADPGVWRALLKALRTRDSPPTRAPIRGVIGFRPTYHNAR